jgi:hypothetical protein
MQLDHISNSALAKLVAALASANTAPPVLLPAPIAAGQSMSGVVAAPRGMRLWALALPAEWTESAISYQLSFDGNAFYEPCDSAGAPLVETALGVGGRAFQVSSYALLRCSFLRVRSGSAAASPVPQAADRTLQLVFLGHGISIAF